MPNYYLVTEKVGEGVDLDEHGRLKHWDLPATWGFAKKKDAEILCPEDRMVAYVAPREWGFAVVMEVEDRYTHMEDHPKWPFRVKVKTSCELRDKHLMPKWAELRPHLKWCRDKSTGSADQTLRKPLRQIDKADYDLIAGAICSAAGK